MIYPSHPGPEYRATEKELQDCLDHGFRNLAFPPQIESQYRADTATGSRRRLWRMGLFSLIVFDLFFLNDHVMLPDIYITAWKIRFFIVTPIGLMSLWAISSESLSRWHDIIAGAMMITGAWAIIALLILSNHSQVPHYHTGLILILLYANLILRLRFRVGIWMTIGVVCTYIAALPWINPMAHAVKLNSGMVLATAGLIGVMGNYQIAYKKRRDYLLTSLQKIHVNKMATTNQELDRLSRLDSLTGIANRRQLDEALAMHWQMAVRDHLPISAIFIDIDHFKAFNDHYGHVRGDDCLRQTAQTLAGIPQRPYDMVARYGGEEFVVLLPKTPPKDAIYLAETLKEAVLSQRIPHAANPDHLYVTVSIGVSGLHPSRNDRPADLLNLADQALYAAKANGRNQVQSSLL